MYKRPAGILSSDPEDLTVLFETHIAAFADVFYYMGAMAERRTQHNNFQFKITKPDEQLKKEPDPLVDNPNNDTPVPTKLQLCHPDKGGV